MNNHIYKPLKKLTSKIGSGATPKGGQSSYKQSGISLIRSQNVLDMTFSKDGLAYIDEDQASKLKNVEVLKGDILLNITGDSIARVCKVPEEVLPARVNQHVSILRTNGKVDPDFLLYYLIYRKNYLLTIGRVGGTRNALTKEAIEKVEIRIDSKQQKIASVLSALDKKIELNNKINAELEQMAQTLYDYWFVQFDFPNEEGKPYKSSGGRMVYNEVLKREIPTGWEVHRLSTLTSFLSRGISPKYIKEEDGIPVLNQKCIREHRVLYEFQRRHDNEAKRASSKLIEKFDVLVNSTGVGTLGRVALVRWLNEEQVTVDSHVTIVRALGKKINRVFFGYSLLTKQAEIENFANGSTGQVELNRSQLSDITLLVPPTKFQNKFHEFYEPIIEKTAINERQNQELAQLRNWLLPMLMNGQVKVNDNSDSDNDERSNDTPKGINIAAELTIGYQKLDLSAHNAFSDLDSRFEAWLSQQGLAARGDIDTATLREIFNAMDDDDK